MMKPPSRCLCAALAFAASACAAAEPRCDVAMLRGVGTSPEQVLACARAVAARPAPADGVSGQLLRAALDGIENASFTRPADDEPGMARLLVAELERRGALGPDDHRTLRAILLLNGRLDEAASDRAAHPAAGEGAMPKREPLGRPTQLGEVRLWRWVAGGKLIREEAVDLAHGVHLVVDASPDCHFCARAVADIERDAALASAFRGALWITRPEHGLDPAYWKRWSDAHPAHPMVVVADVRGWDLAAEWSTPRFRIFRDGRLAMSLLGWTPATQSALLKAAREQGLSPPSW